MIGDINSNAILFKYSPKGMGRLTADHLTYSGVQASRTFAQQDEGRVDALKTAFENIGTALAIPPALLAAIASRESRCGKLLDKEGYGDNGHAFGIMQIDNRCNTVLGLPNPESSMHITQAAHKLKSFWWQVSKDHPDWPGEYQLLGAVAAYNFGPGNVKTMEGIDQGTTHNDYANDVWARAQYYTGHVGE